MDCWDEVRAPRASSLVCSYRDAHYTHLLPRAVQAALAEIAAIEALHTRQPLQPIADASRGGMPPRVPLPAPVPLPNPSISIHSGLSTTWNPHPLLRPCVQPEASLLLPSRSMAGGPWAAAVATGGQVSGASSRGAAAVEAPQISRPSPLPYDESKIGHWIYPSNVTERSYQFEISSVAVRHNTLVSLPTGLGKTLIASVVMYNFHRWFPTGRCVFLAPTKPLVHQQVSAVRRTVGLPLAEFSELTGAMRAECRATLWRSTRMLFLTPQTLVHDIASGICPAHEIVCVVFDEAHKASGNHAYVQVMQMLTLRCGGFRVLALSATPGQTADKVQEVISNLRIYKLEARDESSLVRCYTASHACSLRRAHYIDGVPMPCTSPLLAAGRDEMPQCT